MARVSIQREKPKDKRKDFLHTMTLAHLFLLLLPSGIQKTLPLPFLLRCHVSVPVSFHVVHPLARVRVSHVPLNATPKTYVTQLVKAVKRRDRRKHRKEKRNSVLLDESSMKNRYVCLVQTHSFGATATRVPRAAVRKRKETGRK